MIYDMEESKPLISVIEEGISGSHEDESAVSAKRTEDKLSG
jgi:hypothetical protein